MSENHRYSIRPARLVLALAAISCVVLTACSTKGSTNTSAINPVNWITPYKIDVIQGNFISSEQVEALKPGMTRAQVKDVLGTPLLSDIFHADRWDYVFTMKRRNVEPQSLKLAVFFNGDALDHFEGDKMPSESEFISQIDSGRKLRAVPVLEATEAELNKAAEKSPAPKSAPAPAATATPGPTPATAYPPLESPSR